MISKTMEDAINKQINKEFFSAYLYLSMSAYVESIGLKGFANWLKVQYEEEMFHAMKFYDYLLERGGRVILDSIEKPKTEWNSILNVFEEAYEHEQFITKSINELMDLAISEKDYASVSLLQWYVNEQVEEESTFLDIVEKLKLIGDDKRGLFMMDKDMAQRTYTPPQE